MSRVVFTALLLSLVNATAETPYQSSIEQWRQQREARLKADGGWLTVAGLFWLKEGVNTAGTDPSCDIVLPRGPARVGVFELHNGKTTFRPATGAAMDLKPDAEGDPDEVKLES